MKKTKYFKKTHSKKVNVVCMDSQMQQVNCLQELGSS